MAKKIFMSDEEAKSNFYTKAEVDKKTTGETLNLMNTVTSFSQIYGTNSFITEQVSYSGHDVFGDNSCFATYLFDGDANDLSGVYNGVPLNVTYVAGSHGQAASFNGTNSKIGISNLALPDTITATFYLKVNAFKDQMFLDFGDGRCIFMYNSQDKRLRAQYALANNANTSSTNVLESGVTYFVIATITKTSAVLYLDNVSQVKTSWANYINSKGKSIGYRNDGALYSNCTIDQLKLFNRELTAEERSFLKVGIFTTQSVSKIKIENGVFMYPKGKVGDYFAKTTTDYSGTTGIGTLANGWYWVAKDELNKFTFYTEKPSLTKNGISIYLKDGLLYGPDDLPITPLSFLTMKIRIDNNLIVETADSEIPRTVDNSSEANIVDISGLTTMSFPKIGVETKTEFRHETSKKVKYTRVIDFGALPNNTTKVLAHGIANVEDIKINYGLSYVIYTSGKTYSLTQTNTTTAAQWNAAVDKTNVEMWTGSDRTAYKAFIVVEYTKTTDTVDTPTRLVGNVDYITSPNGTKYKINVDDSGNVSATQIV